MNYLLAWRIFEPIWPTIESHAGPNLTRVSAEYVSWTATRLADKPEDRDRIWSYAEALTLAGRDDEAISVAQSWLHRPDRIAPLEEGDAWALQVEADAWERLGNTDRGDEIFDQLATLSPDENPWVVNFAINRLYRLADQGRWKEALATSDLARSVAERYGTTYARNAVALNRACALYGLGRGSEAQLETDFVLKHSEDAPAATVQVPLCADKEDEAVARIMQLFSDPSSRDDVLGFIQDDLFAMPFVRKSAFPSMGEVVRQRPELLARFLEHVRPIPAAFVPAANLRFREPYDSHRGESAQ